MDNYLLAIVAIAQACTAFLAYRTMKLSSMTNKNMEIVEKATNSMKDALVASTERAAKAEGLATGLEQGRKEPDTRPL